MQTPSSTPPTATCKWAAGERELQAACDQVARSAIEEFLRDHDMEVYLAVFDKSFFQISKALLGDVKVYKRANMDRKLFSKICTGKGYTFI